MQANKSVNIATVNRFGLTESTCKKICAVFESIKPIERVLIYGSCAKGNFKTGSDIDLTVVDVDLDQKTLADVNDLIDDLLLPYKVDLSIYKMLKHPELEEHINRVGLEFYVRTKK
jgi:uncharacterized protein